MSVAIIETDVHKLKDLKKIIHLDFGNHWKQRTKENKFTYSDYDGSIIV